MTDETLNDIQSFQAAVDAAFAKLDDSEDTLAAARLLTDEFQAALLRVRIAPFAGAYRQELLATARKWYLDELAGLAEREPDEPTALDVNAQGQAPD